MSFKSTVTISGPKSKSLRATIPQGIVVYLGLKAGDRLEWSMLFTRPAGERCAGVKKAEKKEEAKT